MSDLTNESLVNQLEELLRDKYDLIEFINMKLMRYCPKDIQSDWDILKRQINRVREN